MVVAEYAAARSLSGGNRTCPKTRQTERRSSCHDGRRDRRLRALLPLHAQPRPALRRLLLRRRDLHRDLLPARAARRACRSAATCACSPRRRPRRRRGFRACKRCEPDAAPGSPAWNRRADVAGRAFRLIADGVVDREGVSGLAARLGFSERQLNRILVAEVGAGAGQLARAQRAQAAAHADRVDRAAFAEVALAAGFGSVRQFNDTIRAIYARTPSELRRRARRPPRRGRAGRGGAAAARPRAARRRGAARLPRRARDPGRRGGRGRHLPALARARARRRRWSR